MSQMYSWKRVKAQIQWQQKVAVPDVPFKMRHTKTSTDIYRGIQQTMSGVPDVHLNKWQSTNT